MQEIAKNQNSVDKNVRSNESLAYNLLAKVQDAINNKKESSEVQKLDQMLRKAFKESNFDNGNEHLSKKIIDGKQYVVLDNQDLDENGNLKSLRHIFNSIVGNYYEFDDGTYFKVVKKIGDTKIYEEFVKPYPASDLGDKSELYEVNKLIARNINEILESSVFGMVENEHHKESNEKRKIYMNNLDIRDTLLLNPNNGEKYKLKIAIANLNNGETILYAKKYLERKKDFNGESPQKPFVNSITYESNEVKLSKSLNLNNYAEVKENFNNTIDEIINNYKPLRGLYS